MHNSNSWIVKLVIQDMDVILGPVLCFCSSRAENVLFCFVFQRSDFTHIVEFKMGNTS